MALKITRDEVAHVAFLARLLIDPSEVDQYAEQLSSVLEHAADIEALELNDVEPTFRPIPLENVLREDVVTVSLPRDTVLSQAPETAHNMFLVPKILSEAP
ncbi:MAG: Asp-tRNA(Asn)/Glu-tRNA(Gln) amidotransferase subunit GatC [Acidimicrobiales bacterium]